VPDQLDDMFDQLVRNLKQLGALDHGLVEQADFDKAARAPTWALNSQRLNFKLQFDDCTIEFPLQWRNNPRMLVTEFVGVYGYLAAKLYVPKGKRNKY